MTNALKKIVCEKYHFIILVFIFTLPLFSCRENTNKNKPLKATIDKALGSKTVVPNLTIYNPFTDSTELKNIDYLNKNYKIYTYINTSCPACVEKIKLWEKLVSEFNQLNVPIIIICESDDEFYTFKKYCKAGYIEKFSYPFFLNYKTGFLKKHPFMEVDDNFQTVLTDKENTILLLGNPTKSIAMKNLYLKKIKKGIANN